MSPAKLVPMPEGERKPPDMGDHDPSGFTRRLQPRHWLLGLEPLPMEQLSTTHMLPA